MKTRKLFPTHSSLAAALAVLAAFLTLLAAPSAFAAALTWDITPGDGATITPGSGTWLDLSGNWNNGVMDTNWNNADPDTATFSGADGAYTITVGGPITTGPGTATSLAGGLVFANSGYTLSASSAQKVTVGPGTAGAYIDVNSGSTATIGNSVTVAKGGTSGSLYLLGGGTLQITAGGTVTNAGTTAAELAAGTTLWINGGTVSLGGSFCIGKLVMSNPEGPSGNFLMDSGTMILGGVGNFALGRTPGDSCIATLNGGTITTAGNLSYGLSGNTANGTFNLNGGTIIVKRVLISAGTPNSTINFNGGTLKAATSASGATFMTGLTTAQIRTNAAIIDPNGQAITIGQPLLHSSISDDPAIDGGLTLANSSGSGTLTLNGANTFTGPTKITAGALSLGNSLALQNSPLDTLNSVAGDAANGLKTTVTTLTLGGLTGNKNLASVFTAGGGGYGGVTALTLNPGTGATPSYSGNIADGAVGMTLTMSGNGTQTLTGANGYTGATTISGGTLALSGSGTLATPSISIGDGATFDVSAQTPPTLAANQNLLGTGSVNGNLTTVATTAIYPGTDGTVGTLTFNNNLTLNAGTQVHLDLDSIYNGANDQIVLNGTGAVLTPNNAQIIINSAGTLDTTTDYVLIDLPGTGLPSFSGSFNASPGWAGVTPVNSANYSIVTSGKQVKLHYSASAALSGVGSATPPSVTHGMAPLLTVTVTPGTFPASTGIAVKANLSTIGGSATQTFYDDGTHGDVTAGDNIFSYNGCIIPAGTSLGAKSFSATITDAQGRHATANIALTVAAATVTWGASPANANWGTAGNWVTGFSPGAGDLVYFDTSSQLSPNLETGYSVDSVTFNSGAGSYTIGGSTLTLTGSGVNNNSANAQTLNVPVAMGVSQTINAASGDVTLGGAVSGSGKSLTKVGTGKLTLSAANSYDGGTEISSGKLVLGGSGNLGNAASLLLDGGQLDLGTLSRTVGAVSVTAPADNGGDTITNGSLTGTSYAVSSTTDTTISANLLGSGGFAKSGDGTVILSGNNSFSGPSSIIGGKVSLRHANALGVTGSGNGTTLTYGNGSQIELLGGISYAPEDLTLDAGPTLVDLESVSGNNTWNGAIKTTGVQGLTYVRIQSDADTLTLAGTMTGNNENLAFALQGEGNILVSGQITGVSGLISGSAGAGTNTLNNPANNFTGPVTISGGTLKLGASGVIPDGAGKGNVTVTGTLDLNGYSETINGLSGAGIVDNTASSKTSTLTVGGNNQSSTFRGVIQNTVGTLALTKTDSGTLTLSGNNTYSGNTTVNGGILAIAVASIATNSTVSVAAGAVLQLDFAEINVVSRFATNGVFLPAGVYSAANVAPFIAGTGSLKVVSTTPPQPTIAPVAVSGTNLVVTVPTVAGFNYVLQSTTNLTPTINWQNVSTNAGTGVNLILNVPIEPGKPRKFLRFWVY